MRAGWVLDSDYGSPVTFVSISVFVFKSGTLAIWDVDQEIVISDVLC